MGDGKPGRPGADDGNLALLTISLRRQFLQLAARPTHGRIKLGRAGSRYGAAAGVNAGIGRKVAPANRGVNRVQGNNR